METLEFYLKNAKNAIRVFGNKKLLLSEDAISHVAYQMMHADERYDGKTGTKEGYRWDCARYAVKTLLSKKKKIKEISIDTINEAGSIADILTKDVKPANQNNLIVNDIIALVNTADYLTDRERACLLDKYINNKTLQEIGDSICTTREYVRQVVDKAIYKIRKHV